MARYHSEWLYAIQRIQTEWEFRSDWCGVIRSKLETSIRIEKEWIIIGRSHSDFHYEWVRASETDFAFIQNRSEWIGDIRIETESIFIPKLAAGYLVQCSLVAGSYVRNKVTFLLQLLIVIRQLQKKTCNLQNKLAELNTRNFRTLDLSSLTVS